VTPQKLVSIIIPVYNTKLYLYNCIKSIQNQTYKNFECLIIDDGSEDESYLIAQSFCNIDDRFKLFRQKNGGLSSARNKGINHAVGHYISFLDSDDYWAPDKLLNQMKVLETSNYINSVVFSRGIGISPSGKIFNDHLIVYNNNPLDLLSHNSVDGSGSSILIPKEIVDKIGFFNESLRSFEDLEYWFRIAISGYRFLFVESPDVIMTQRNDSLRKSKKGMQKNNLMAMKLQLNVIPVSYSFVTVSNKFIKRLQLSRKYCEENKFFLNCIYLLKIFFIYVQFSIVFFLKKLNYFYSH
jgi:glycosyltransferase involved in cell wall biosynthesis